MQPGRQRHQTVRQPGEPAGFAFHSEEGTVDCNKKIVHAAEPTRAEEAQLAIDCATRLRADIVLPISEKLGFTLEVTGLWCRTKTQNRSASFTRRDPFINE